MRVSRGILWVMIIWLAALGLARLFGLPINLTFNLLLLVLCGALAQLLAWAARRMNEKVWIVTGLLLLMALIVPTSLLMAYRQPGALTSLIQTWLFLLPSLALLNAALLLYAGLAFLARDDPSAPVQPSKRQRTLALVLMVCLVAKTLHNLYDFLVWDNTYDPFGYLWLLIPIFAVLFSALMLMAVLPGRTKLAGLVYLVLLPALLIAVSALAQRVNFHEVTRARAERIVRAIEAYYVRQGRYPETLDQLTPWYLLSLPKPMIIYGQDWCYDRGEKYYRLGYLDRQHWSDPRLIGHIYKIEGKPEAHSPMCLKEFNDFHTHEPGYRYSYWKEMQ